MSPSRRSGASSVRAVIAVLGARRDATVALTPSHARAQGAEMDERLRAP